MEVIEVFTRRRRGAFVRFPSRLYRVDPLWAPPLWIEEMTSYDGRNPVLAHSKYALFLAEERKEVFGRILAYVDHNYNSHYGSTLGFFGSFECVDDPHVAQALLSSAEEWLRQAGMSAIRGPINPVPEQWGFLREGFDSSPVFMAPYNPPRYNSFMDMFGYAKIMDLYAFEADAKKGYRIPERFIRFRDALLRRRPGLSVRKLDFSRIEREAEHIWNISNSAIRGNWGYVPLDRGELLAMFRKLRTIADRDAVLFVEESGKPVGYCLGFPDLNVILKRIKGRLFPFGLFGILAGIRKVTDYRLWALAVLPEYRRLGLDVLLYLSIYENLAPRGVRLEANWVLESNRRMLNALEKLELVKTKTYRIYEKPLS
jgi:GNAT superfamily N-acetyltransferase